MDASLINGNKVLSWSQYQKHGMNIGIMCWQQCLMWQMKIGEPNVTTKTNTTVIRLFWNSCDNLVTERSVNWHKIAHNSVNNTLFHAPQPPASIFHCIVKFVIMDFIFIQRHQRWRKLKRQRPQKTFIRWQNCNVFLLVFRFVLISFVSESLKYGNFKNKSE